LCPAPTARWAARRPGGWGYSRTCSADRRKFHLFIIKALIFKTWKKKLFSFVCVCSNSRPVCEKLDDLHCLSYVCVAGSPLLRAVSGCSVLEWVLRPRRSVQVHNNTQPVLPVQDLRWKRVSFSFNWSPRRCRVYTYSAQLNALSKAWREPPTKGSGGLGSLAIHHPTGILTAFSPLDAMKLKSLSVM
jgi:hypothetical protein